MSARAPAHVAKDFHRNVELVHDLIEFDRFIVDFAIAQVEGLHGRLKQRFLNPSENGEHTLLALRRVREHDSLRRNYQTLFNQGVVLLVSYFTSAVVDIFRVSVPRSVGRESASHGLHETMRVTVKEIVRLQSEPESLGEFVERKKDISFQDMRSITQRSRFFVGVEIPRGEHTNNVILAQACRHVFAHANGVADGRLLKQMAKVAPRTVKPELTLGERLQFTPEEVRAISNSMTIFVDLLAESTQLALN